MKEELDMIKEELKETKEQSIAYQLLGDMKKQNKRQFIIILVILGLWFITGIYLVYLLNDISVIEDNTTVTQENDSGYNNYIGNDGDITNS